MEHVACKPNQVSKGSQNDAFTYEPRKMKLQRKPDQTPLLLRNITLPARINLVLARETPPSFMSLKNVNLTCHHPQDNIMQIINGILAMQANTTKGPHCKGVLHL